jgi:hypothetical protein
MAGAVHEVTEPGDEGPAAGAGEVGRGGEDRRDRDTRLSRHRTPDWPNLGYVARSRRPSSPVRLDPSTAGLRENKRLGNSFLASYIDEVLDIYIAGLLQDSN